MGASETSRAFDGPGRRGLDGTNLVLYPVFILCVIAEP
jgi:hypothetical protein